MAETASRVTGSERTDGRSVTITVPDIPAAFLAARTLCNLAEITKLKLLREGRPKKQNYKKEPV
jgi:hypothetical protein